MRFNFLKNDVDGVVDSEEVDAVELVVKMVEITILSSAAVWLFRLNGVIRTFANM